jgi:uncharacterized membrane protein
MNIYPLLTWYLLISLVGWLTLPLIHQLFSGLWDRGYAFARILGLLLWAYVFWLLASLGILPNEPGSILLALLIIILISGWSIRKTGLKVVGAWIRQNMKLILVVELLFLFAFLGMAAIRAANPDIVGTEKPMELAFINAILNSPAFPPHDPWLSGYAISYYYFGYVMVAMVAKLTNIPGSVAFNLGVSLIFALTAIGAYGMVYNLLAVIRDRSSSSRSPWPISISSLLGPLFILLVSNAEGFLEVLHARGFFWRTDGTGELVSTFWQWLDIRNLTDAPAQPFSWQPSRYLWWWRASRVVQDYDFQLNWKEIIDEFPVFSYILADLHPHVLAMPFAFLAMALTYNLFCSRDQGHFNGLRHMVNVRTLAWAGIVTFVVGLAFLWAGIGLLSLSYILVGAIGLTLGGFSFLALLPTLRLHGIDIFSSSDLGEKEMGLPIYMSASTLIWSAIILGGLAFVNTWDFPFYIALFVGAYIIKRYMDHGGGIGELIKEVIGLGLLLVIASVVLYLPFYLGFSSQAGGIIPNLIYLTRGAHLWVMFATLFFPLFAYLIYLWKTNQGGEYFKKALAITFGFILFLWVVSLLFALGAFLISSLGELYLNSIAAPDLLSVLGESFNRRLTHIGGWVTVSVMMVFTVGLLLRLMNGGRESPKASSNSSVFLSSNTFSLFLILLGALLVLVPEFFYLRDMFGWRINTIFKFYYQAWLLWGVVAAFGTGLLLFTLSGKWRVLFAVGLTMVLIVGLTYTVLSIWTRTNGFQPTFGWTLDGTAYLERQAADEATAIGWLGASEEGVVAEAVGGSYSGYARVSTLSGQPTVLGWPGHESQWRGGSREMGTREMDIERLYCSRSWEEAQEIIDRYGIRYIYIGPLERQTYTADRCPGGLEEAKFSRNLTAVFNQDEVIIYTAP